eukprot:4142181-Amphidinium_carterae.1
MAGPMFGQNLKLGHKCYCHRLRANLHPDLHHPYMPTSLPSAWIRTAKSQWPEHGMASSTSGVHVRRQAYEASTRYSVTRETNDQGWHAQEPVNRLSMIMLKKSMQAVACGQRQKRQER